ncbi:hypothetical protein C8R43DRAFT_951063 [Mycena crocata]|nr:hypothetical protein C8R43DRAFT_951063 [Mycena crocata]
MSEASPGTGEFRLGLIWVPLRTLYSLHVVSAISFKFMRVDSWFNKGTSHLPPIQSRMSSISNGLNLKTAVDLHLLQTFIQFNSCGSVCYKYPHANRNCLLHNLGFLRCSEASNHLEGTVDSIHEPTNLQLTLASLLVLRDLATCRPPLCWNHAERVSAGQGEFTLRVGYRRVVDIGRGTGGLGRTFWVDRM